MKHNSNVNGFEVHVLKGREITAGQVAMLSNGQKQQVVTKVNGPHHTAKWAKALQQTKPYPRVHDLRGVPEVLVGQLKFRHLANHLTVNC